MISPATTLTSKARAVGFGKALAAIACFFDFDLWVTRGMYFFDGKIVPSRQCERIKKSQQKGIRQLSTDPRALYPYPMPRGSLPGVLHG